jgi:hypothetical protein
MALLLDLPPEILSMIISCLRVSLDIGDLATGAINREIFLPFAQTNRALWNIARPFLYHDIEILVKIEHYWGLEAPKVYELDLQTSLLCRTLQDDPSLASQVRSLNLRGFLIELYSTGGHGRNEGQPKRTKASSVFFTTSQLANLLISFNNVRSFHVHGTLKGDIHYAINQLLLSCMKSMTVLEQLHLYVDSQTETDVIFHFLNATSTRLRSLSIGPFYDRELNRSLTDWPTDSYPAPTSNLKLDYLVLPADRLPLAGFGLWVNNLTQLNLDGIILSDGRTNQGSSIESVLAPMASTLVHLDLHINEFFDAPSLSDMDMSQCVALKTFSYAGPWWITPDDDASNVCQTLFSTLYSSLTLEHKDGQHRHKVRLGSLKVLREAFALAHLQNSSPEEFEITLNFEDVELYAEEEADDMDEEIDGLMEDLRERGIDGKSSVKLPDYDVYENDTD